MSEEKQENGSSVENSGEVPEIELIIKVSFRLCFIQQKHFTLTSKLLH